MRFKVGNKVRVYDWPGKWYVGRIVRMGGGFITVGNKNWNYVCEKIHKFVRHYKEAK